MNDKPKALASTNPDSAPMLRDVTCATIGAVADLMAACGKLDRAVELRSAAPIVGHLAEHGFVWLHRGVQRFAESLGHVQSRAADEGVDLEGAADVIEQAMPLLGKTASQDKRRMMEEVILNAAGRAEAEGAAVNASRALQLVDLLPDEVALLFSVIIRELRASPNGLASALKAPLPDCGLPPWMFTWALEVLQGRFPRGGDGTNMVGEWDALVEQQPLGDDGQGGIKTDSKSYILTPRGMWLANWIQYSASIADRETNSA